MADDGPGRPPVGRLLDALRVRRNVAVGAVVGAVLAVTLYTIRLLELFGRAPDRGSPLLFLGLAVVLALSTAGLVATVLTLATAVRLARDSGNDEQSAGTGAERSVGNDDEQSTVGGRER